LVNFIVIIMLHYKKKINYRYNFIDKILSVDKISLSMILPMNLWIRR